MASQSVRLKSRPLLVELVKAANGGNGYSLRELEDRLPCSKSTIGDILNGNKTVFSAYLGERIAEVVGIAPAVLLAPTTSIKRGRPSTKQDVAA